MDKYEAEFEARYERFRNCAFRLIMKGYRGYLVHGRGYAVYGYAPGSTVKEVLLSKRHRLSTDEAHLALVGDLSAAYLPHFVSALDMRCSCRNQKCVLLRATIDMFDVIQRAQRHPRRPDASTGGLTAL